MSLVRKVDELLQRKGELEVEFNDALTLLERAVNMLLHGTPKERGELAAELMEFIEPDDYDPDDPELDRMLDQASAEIRAAFRVPTEDEKEERTRAMMAELIRQGEAEAFICQRTGKVNYRLTKPKEGSQ